MHIATSNTYHSPQTTTTIVLVVAPLMLVVLGTWFVVSYRRNARTAAGGLTPTEARLNRGHGVAVMVGLFASMGLAVGAVLSPTVRDTLSKVGDHSRWIPVVLVPLVVAYLRWLGRRITTATIERAGRDR